MDDFVMKLQIIKGDITKQETDAIINAANTSLLGGGGVDGAIHRAAGPELLAECSTLCGCKTGKAKVTKGYRLPARFVIHTPGPIWRGGKNHESELLASCYQSCLEIASNQNLKTIAFPSISTSIYGFPLDLAANIAVKTILNFLKNNDRIKTILMVCYDYQTKKAYDHALEMMK